ncbi:nuclear protein [Puccinia graminis f. sp. tritici]|uniref:Non-structural maintenance of chromosomes element 4 n=1 Tax=Puccinia graminis f. sp. tritici TaxID=56615 RepID=A0A5B0SB26_PUCGR|nr:nuclear protein [Puccinia graminis f. sp. tritici]
MDSRKQNEREDSECSSIVEESGDGNTEATIRQTQEEIMAGATKGVYIPQRDKDEAREARRILRGYEERANEMMENASLTTAEEFDRQVLGLDDAFNSQVRAPADATIDSRALRLYSETGLKKAKLLKTDLRGFEPDEFVFRFKQVMAPSIVASLMGDDGNGQDGSEAIDWFEAGRRLMPFSRRVPTMDLM